MQLSEFKKKLHHENWPTPVFYAPVILYYLYSSIKHRKFNYFTAVNPGLETGGLCGFSKYKSFGLAPASLVPITVLLEQKEFTKEELGFKISRAQLTFPMILKPDQGERGFLVSKVESLKEMATLLRGKSSKINFLLQEYVEGPLELGVFLIKKNGAWAISSITSKKFLSVEGDGASTLRTLIEKDEKAKKFFDANTFRNLNLDTVPEAGDRVILEPIGNHCRGTDFVDECSRIDESIDKIFNSKLQDLKGVRYCRLDIRSKSWAAVKIGEFKIMEINGVSAEPGHIYDPSVPLSQAYKDLFHHWSEMSSIAGEELKGGDSFEALMDTVHSVRGHLKKKKELQKMQNKIVDVLASPNLDLDMTVQDILNSFDAQTLIDKCSTFEEKDGYKRAVLYKDKNTEIIFCHWPEGAKTPVHNHPLVDCSFKCVGGEMIDVRSMGRDRLLIKQNEISQIDDSQGAHQMVNMSADCAYTIHIYKKIKS